jgi:hypothetical protein
MISCRREDEDEDVDVRDSKAEESRAEQRIESRIYNRLCSNMYGNLPRLVVIEESRLQYGTVIAVHQRNESKSLEYSVL